jgi:hypothetical protein
MIKLNEKIYNQKNVGRNAITKPTVIGRPNPTMLEALLPLFPGVGGIAAPSGV